MDRSPDHWFTACGLGPQIIHSKTIRENQFNPITLQSSI
jgi:hypothetical protein